MGRKDSAVKFRSAGRPIYIMRVSLPALAHHQFDRTVVAAENLVVYAHRFEAIVQALGGDEIIDAPSCVLLTRFETVAPPRIGPFEVRIEKTERIGESTLEQTGELGTFFVGESRIFAIRLRVLQVDFAVCHVQVAAHYDRFLRVERQKIVTECVVPRHSVVQTAQTILRVGHIGRDQVEIFKFQRHNAPFMVVLVDAQAISDTEWVDACENRGSRVTFLFGIVPITLVAFELKIDLSFLQLSFLQAKTVCVELSEGVFKAFLAASPETVDVPRYKFHVILSCRFGFGKVQI